VPAGKHNLLENTCIGPQLTQLYLDHPTLRQVVSHGEAEPRSYASLDALKIPKNRSTGDLLASVGKAAEDGKTRGSFDAGSAGAFHSTAQQPILAEHEHGLGISGLRRIRQHPPSRAPTQPPSPTTSFALAPRSSSMVLGSSSSRGFAPGGLTSPNVNFAEDLSRFPSESLHSFSFAHQSEDALHNRQSVMKRAVEFMRDGFGWGTEYPGLMSAQAKVSGDAEIQKMMELLVRANLLASSSQNTSTSRILNESVTGPADVDGTNVFEKAFMPRPENSNRELDLTQSLQKSESRHFLKPLSTHPEPSLDSEASAPEPAEPQSPSDLPPQPDSKERASLKRTYTDISLLTLQTKLTEALAKPYKAMDGSQESGFFSPTPRSAFGKSHLPGINTPSLVHGHNNRWVPAAQAIFTTEGSSPWTILAANDLACLVFGVTKAEVRKLSMLEVVREDRRAWLEDKLRSQGSEAEVKTRHMSSRSARTSPRSSTSMAMGGGVTAKLLSKPSWRLQRAQTGDHQKKQVNSGAKLAANKSRGVLLCGDIVPIQKRNGAIGAASLWVKEKRGGLIWVLEEIAEDLAYLKLDEDAKIVQTRGATTSIWGDLEAFEGRLVQDVIPGLPLIDGDTVDKTALEKNEDAQYLTSRSTDGVNVPVSVSMDPGTRTLRVSSFPHIAGIVVLSASNLNIMNSNSVFSAALFGQGDPSGLRITELMPQFDEILTFLTEEDKINLVDGIVVPEQSFRRARALLAIREGKGDAAAIFLRPAGLVAKHRDGSEINVDVQMRVVLSERKSNNDSVIEEKSEDGDSSAENSSPGDTSEIVYALWVTYSRQFHSASLPGGSGSPLLSRPGTPHHRPSPGQTQRIVTPDAMDEEEVKAPSPSLTLSQQIREAASQPISQSPPKPKKLGPQTASTSTPSKALKREKKKITDFTILEDMGQGAYGQVKGARHIATLKKVVLKYVTKRRILVDTWTRDRVLGTVPLEIHVLDYLRKDGLRHPNIVEMTEFFEDDVNYYIEMVPHGLPGMDLFDYIEMRANMDEGECRNIFLQVVAALHHLHTKALVVHRDIKDENIILDGEGMVKLIDFGSAAYIKNGPFDVFVGTIGTSSIFPRHLSPIPCAWNPAPKSINPLTYPRI